MSFRASGCLVIAMPLLCVSCGQQVDLFGKSRVSSGRHHTDALIPETQNMNPESEAIQPVPTEPETGEVVALLFGSFPGFHANKNSLNKMRGILQDPRSGIKPDRIIVVEDASKDQVMSLTGQYAANAGQMFWYFFGHGSPDGTLHAWDPNANLEPSKPSYDDGEHDSQGFKFTEVADVIRGARTRPLQKFFVLVDTCFSGNVVNGTTPVITEDGSVEQVKNQMQKMNIAIADTLNQGLDRGGAYDAPIYRQALALSSVDKNHEGFVIQGSKKYAEDDANTEVVDDSDWISGFAVLLNNGFQQLKQDQQGAPLRGLLTYAQENGVKVDGVTPIYRAYPQDILEMPIVTGF